MGLENRISRKKRKFQQGNAIVEFTIILVFLAILVFWKVYGGNSDDRDSATVIENLEEHESKYLEAISAP